MAPGLENKLPSLPGIVSIAETVWAPRAGEPPCKSTATEHHEHPLSEKDWQASRVLQCCYAVHETFEWLCICHGSSLAELLCSTPGLSFRISLQNRLCTSSLTFFMSVCEDRAIWFDDNIRSEAKMTYGTHGLRCRECFSPGEESILLLLYNDMIWYNIIYIINCQSSSYGA